MTFNTTPESDRIVALEGEIAHLRAEHAKIRAAFMESSTDEENRLRSEVAHLRAALETITLGWRETADTLAREADALNEEYGRDETATRKRGRADGIGECATELVAAVLQGRDSPDSTTRPPVDTRRG